MNWTTNSPSCVNRLPAVTCHTNLPFHLFLHVLPLFFFLSFVASQNWIQVNFLLLWFAFVWKRWAAPIKLAFIVVSWLQAVLLKRNLASCVLSLVMFHTRNAVAASWGWWQHSTPTSIGLWHDAVGTVGETNVCCSFLLLIQFVICFYL